MEIQKDRGKNQRENELEGTFKKLENKSKSGKARENERDRQN